MISKTLLDSMPHKIEMYLSGTGWGQSRKLAQDVSINAFKDKPEKYLQCGRTALENFLEENAAAMVAPFQVLITGTVFNHQLCSADEARIQDGALRIGHFAVSTHVDFADNKDVDLRRRGIGRSFIRGLARLMKPVFEIEYIDFDLNRVRGAGAEAYALFTDGLGAVAHGDLRRLRIDHVLAEEA